METLFLGRENAALVTMAMTDLFLGHFIVQGKIILIQFIPPKIACPQIRSNVSKSIKELSGGGEGAALVWITVNVMASTMPSWNKLVYIKCKIEYLLKQWYPTVTVSFEILQIWLTQRIQ